MAETLPNGAVVPDADGDALISSTGIAEMRALGASVDGQLGTKSPVGHTHSPSDVTGLAALLAAKADVEAVELGPNADADTLVAPNRYVETNAADAGTSVNFPEQRAGVLDVAANADRLHVWQLWRPYAGNRLYMRSRTSGTWDSWEQLVTGTDSRLTDARTPTAHTHPVSDVDGLAARLAALEYDTGIRNITAMFPEVTSGSVYLQRTSRAITVALYGVVLGGRTGTDSYWHLSKFLPSGFRPAPGALFMIPVIAGIDTVVRFRVVSAGQMTIYSPSSAQQFYGSITFTTNDPAPATLPGTPA